MKILALTSIRSDYDLMSSLYRKISKDNFFDFGIIIAGAHHSDLHEKSAKRIYADELHVVAEIDNFEKNDNFVDQITSAGNLLKALGTAVDNFGPDLIFVVGDREDALMMAITATYMRIPAVHFYGGDHATDGHVDNQVRHAISKLATFHFVSAAEHLQRLICSGEEIERIKVVGSLAIDNFVNEENVERNQLFRELFGADIKDGDKVGFLLHHPITEEMDDLEIAFDAVVEELRRRKMLLVIGRSNNDAKYSKLLRILEKYRKIPTVRYVNSLSRNTHINFMRNIEVMIGNSSSGILEAATLKLPVVNLGIRQQGRLSPRNVIFSTLEPSCVKESLTLALSREFSAGLDGIVNPYGNGNSADLVVGYLKSLKFSEFLKKQRDPLCFLKEPENFHVF